MRCPADTTPLPAMAEPALQRAPKALLCLASCERDQRDGRAEAARKPGADAMIVVGTPATASSRRELIDSTAALDEVAEGGCHCVGGGVWRRGRFAVGDGLRRNESRRPAQSQSATPGSELQSGRVPSRIARRLHLWLALGPCPASSSTVHPHLIPAHFEHTTALRAQRLRGNRSRNSFGAAPQPGDSTWPR